MPNKKTHQKLTLIAIFITLPVIFLLRPMDSVSVIAGTIITYLPQFGPDLDINTRRFGVIGEFFGLKAYAKIVPHRYGFRKRHWTRLRIWNIMILSHIPFLGTFLRALILLLPLSLTFILFDLWLPQVLRVALFVWLGMSYSDIWHVVADLIVSDFKETKKDYWRRRKYISRKQLTREQKSSRI
jgi:uncharacterized metal-binding protein